MSTTLTKRAYASAHADAIALQELFTPDHFLQWEFAGSLRRRVSHVGDVEHVAIPRLGDLPGAGLFAEGKTNLLFARLDELLAEGVVTKHVYSYGETGAPEHRWGDKYRGCDFRGFNHEFFLADPTNWGAILLMRTGPADFSRRFVGRFHGTRMRQHLGYLRRWEGLDANGQDTFGGVVPVPDEGTYFRLAGLDYLKPEQRR